MLVATLLAIVLSGAPAAAAAWVQPSSGVACSEVDEQAERDEAAWVEATRTRPVSPRVARDLRVRPRLERSLREVIPKEARAFVPPQRKSLLRLHL